MNKPYSIKIFLPGGDPDGLRTIEKSGWSGAGIVIPRALMKEAKLRPELARTGVYVLLGPAEESDLPRIYIGEGDPVWPRLAQHSVKKDFWTSCISFSSKDGNLNKAHVQHLESCLVSLAARAKRCVLENGNSPALPSLSEADAADAEGFLAEMLLCFPVLGLNVFNAAAAPPKGALRFHIAAKGVTAEGIETPEGFLVYKGSRAVKDTAPSCLNHLIKLRAALVSNGVLMPSGDGHIFTQDYSFSAPSTASGVVLGRSSNGRVDWKTKGGQTLKEVQKADAGK